MKKFSIIAVLLSIGMYSARAQQIVHACCDTSICIPGSPVDLSCTVDSGNTGSILDISDDTYSQLVNLGFQFVFFGNPYSKCVLSTNAYITFDLSLAEEFSPWQILFSAPSPSNPLNSIYGPWHDVDPSQPPFGSIAFGTFGTAPNRFFVYNFCGVPMYDCNDTLFTGQIILYEGSNNIETHIGDKRLCETWNLQRAIHGLQDSTGNVAVIVPGRNSPQVWMAFNEGKRFTPNGNSYDITNIPYAPIPFAAGGIIWKDQNGNEVGQGFDLSVNPTTTTTYIAVLASCGFSADTVTVTVGGVAVNITASNLTCLGSNDGSILADPTGNNGPYVFVWTNSNGDTIRVNSSNTSDLLDNLTGGTYVVTVTDDDGCSSTFTTNVGVNPFLANFSVSPSIVCPSTAVSFTNNSIGSNVTYAWTFGDGASATTTDATHVYGVAGIYTVQLVMTGDAGCTDTATQQVQVHPTISTSFSFATAPFCIGNEISFTDLSTANPGDWSWSFGDGSTSNVQNPTHSYSSADTFFVHLLATDNFCGTSELTLPIIVNFIPDPQLRDDTTLCTNEVLTMAANAEGTSYLWSSGDTTQVVNLPAPQQTTLFTVIVDNYGCKGTDSVLITIDCIFELPTGFSPNGDGKNDLLHPLGSNVNSYHMTIFNRWGQEVYDRTTSNLLDGWDGKFKGEPQALGVYVVSVKGTFISGEPFSKTGNITLIR